MARGQRVGDIWEGLERAEGLEGSEDGDRERVEGCKAGGVLEFGKGLGDPAGLLRGLPWWELSPGFQNDLW